jgi:anti-anti-sigma factor
MTVQREAETLGGECRCPEVEVCIKGELDYATVPRTREQLHDALSLHPQRLVVDLAGCTFFDAMGINMLLEVHRQAWRQDAALTLRGCSQRHLRILALMGLHGVFDIDVDGLAVRRRASVRR